MPQSIISFIPEGMQRSKMQFVTLLSEELEALKLMDYEEMDQVRASKVMNISRPTFTRIYKRARKKIAEGLVELKSIKLNGGNSYLSENWFSCGDCSAVFNIPENAEFEKTCPMCSGKSIERIKNPN